MSLAYPSLSVSLLPWSDAWNETPWISSIPFASFFFGRKGSSEEMDNLMIIVRATISDLQEQEARLRR